MPDPPFALHGAMWGGAISGVTGAGTKELLDRIWTMLETERPEDSETGGRDGEPVPGTKE